MDSSDNVGLSYDAALDQLLHFGPDYDGGLSNHGPMALDALASLGRHDLFEPFLDDYVGRLEVATNDATVDGDLADELRARLPELVDIGASQAGHGLLRVAHAVRALDRSDTPARRRELAAAMSYWRSGGRLAGPDALTGSRPLADVAAELPRMEADVSGLLVEPLTEALRRPDVVELLADIEPAADIVARLDDLALMAAEAMAANRGIAAFGLLHGVTVSWMARRLLPYLDDHGARLLEARVVAFVVAAVVGLDRSQDGDGLTGPIDDSSDVDDLVDRLAGKLGDHDIKFSEAAAGLYQRTGSPTVVVALKARMTADF